MMMMAATLAMASVLSLLFVLPDTQASLVPQIVIISVAGVLAIVSPLVFLLTRSPYSFVIAVIGFRGTGKTVFLTSLFDRLMASEVPGFDFAPYGVETLDEVTKNLDCLASGNWLPSTKSEDIYHFRAQAVSGRGLFARRFKLEIGDYPGESSSELAEGSGKRLHRSDYFKDVVQSDAVFLVVGCDSLVDADAEQLAHEENALIAALNYLKEMKGVRVGRRMRAPLVVVVTKSDVIGNAEQEWEAVSAAAKQALTEKMQRLVGQAQKSCIAYSCHAVSAAGHVGSDGSPPTKLAGLGVAAPVRWALGRLAVDHGSSAFPLARRVKRRDERKTDPTDSQDTQKK